MSKENIYRKEESGNHERMLSLAKTPGVLRGNCDTEMSLSVLIVFYRPVHFSC